ncbi:MAG: translation elongation factor Ts [Lachnospiraceae bacterium]|nr:translation elongation factor Ts [Lachnospiraceae bacterium]MDD7327622.1 translation elongation factor Ts [Lachnospiraceae bacterium]MDY2759320.1 translation elongation factor Ts [Lachnospiraceae bacterium]
MAVTAKMVKDLREQTGAGMMDCKKALNETNGDMDAAVEYLRKNGQAKAEKKADRIAAEGLVDIVTEGNTAAIVEVNSETDFVANNDKFKAYVKEVANAALATKACDIDGFLADKWISDSSKTVKEALDEEIAVIGEKLSIRRFEKVTADKGIVVSYIHGGGRIGVVINADCPAPNDDIKEALHNVAMQIAALNPKYIRDSDVDQEYLDHETEIIKAQIENDPKEAAKPDKVKAGIVKGRLNKELKEVCLMDQVYVKAEDGKQSVAKYLDQVAKAAGTDLTIKKFVRFETGEGLEKRNENFAEEVAKQMQ